MVGWDGVDYVFFELADWFVFGQCIDGCGIDLGVEGFGYECYGVWLGWMIVFGYYGGGGQCCYGWLVYCQQVCIGVQFGEEFDYVGNIFIQVKVVVFQGNIVCIVLVGDVDVVIVQQGFDGVM